jgi:hypothetical protein
MPKFYQPASALLCVAAAEHNKTAEECGTQPANDDAPETMAAATA